MAIRFSKSTGHFGEYDLDYISIDTEGITVDQVEEAFQRFLKACGYIIDDMIPPEED